MAGGHYEKLGEEETALHDSWRDVLRIAILVGLLAVVGVAATADYHRAIKMVDAVASFPSANQICRFDQGMADGTKRASGVFQS